MLSEEEKEAIETLETEGIENNYLEAKILLNLVDKQQKEIEEKSTIIMAGAEKVKQLEKEIEREKQYTDFYKDLCNKQQKEIEEFKKWHDVFLEMYIHKDKVGANYISKDKIRELKEKVEKEMISNPYDFSYMINELLEENDE